jgi:hypothetical protein
MLITPCCPAPLAGGSRNTSRSVLAALGALGEAERAMEAARTAFDAAEAKLKSMAGSAKTHQKWVGLAAWT